MTEAWFRMGSVGVWSVAYGAGCMPAAVESELGRTGASRVLAVTSPSARATAPFSEICRILASRLVAVFDGVVPHLPLDVVFEARRMFSRSGANAILSFGGGAVSDTGKAVRMAVSSGRPDSETLDDLPPGMVSEGISHIAVPTTLSGAEFSAAAGVTDSHHQEKVIVSRPGMAPNMTILDPAVLETTPLALWATGAAKMLGDALDKLTDTNLRPHLEPLVVRSAATLARSLYPAQLESPGARLDASLASWATVFAGVQSGSRGGATTAVRHLLGPALGLPHAGITAALLPHMYRFSSAAVPEERHRSLAQAFGLGTREPAAEVTQFLSDLVTQAPVPSSLSEMGVTAEQLNSVGPLAAEHVRRVSLLHRETSDDAVTQMLLAAL